ncbi:conserved hypothetical protein [metagenome]|uniref:Mycothiol-dependent maleylpyruvate isomerase metal-binding domain-containing protein n=1 Tax=metagenome TaxID=256318 RepID=A0A2P2BZ42_9ZZZZ
MSEDWFTTRLAFVAAARWYGATTASVEADDWQLVGLGEWTVRDLVGHTSRSLLTVESYLDGPAGPLDLTTPTAYFRAAMASIGDPAAVSQRGVAAGEALGDRPAEAVAAIITRVVALIEDSDGDDHVATPVGGMRLVDYLPTRTFELTVHTCDLAVALGGEPSPPAEAARASLDVLAGCAVDAGSAAALLLAATGRRGLPDGFTIL